MIFLSSDCLLLIPPPRGFPCPPPHFSKAFCLLPFMPLFSPASLFVQIPLLLRGLAETYLLCGPCISVWTSYIFSDGCSFLCSKTASRPLDQLLAFKAHRPYAGEEKKKKAWCPKTWVQIMTLPLTSELCLQANQRLSLALGVLICTLWEGFYISPWGC